MRFEWDETKAVINLQKHGVAFEDVSRFSWDTALMVIDNRHQREVRARVFGYIGPRLYCPVCTLTYPTARVISLRKANSKEVRRYAQTET